MAVQACSPWVTPDQLCCEGDGTATECDGTEVPLVYEWTDDQIIQAASNILFARTCFLYPGECEAQVWPCVNPCDRRLHPCAVCCNYNAIELPTDYEVFEVSEITFDGVAQNLLDYQLTGNNVLLKLDGPWPHNSFGIEGSSGTEVIITYTFGRTPPVELQMAAADLACELKQACNGNDCALPPHVKSVARRGVEFDIESLQVLLARGATGIPSVDYALSIHGKCPRDAFYDPARGIRGMRVGRPLTP